MAVKKAEVGTMVEPTEQYVVANKGTTNLTTNEKHYYVQKFDMFKIDKHVREIVAEGISPIMRLQKDQ